MRVSWKIAPDFTFDGCNEQFARDAGLTRKELFGATDFDRRLPWRNQAAKYRADDERVFSSGEADVEIVERQQSASGGITWVRAGKAHRATAIRATEQAALLRRVTLERIVP